MTFVEDIAALVATNASGLLAAAPGWKRQPLGTIAKVINGFAFESKFFQNGNGSDGIPLVRIRDVVGGRSETRYAGPIPEGYWVHDGDLLVGMDGDFNLALWRGGKALLNQRVCKITCDDQCIRKAYVAHILPGYLKLINDFTSSITVKHLSSRTLLEIPIPVPPIAVQDRLVARVDELFAEIAEGESALADARAGLDTYRSSLLSAAFSGELTATWRKKHPPKESMNDVLVAILKERRKGWKQNPIVSARRYAEPASANVDVLPRLPEGWVWASLQQIAFISGGITVDKKRKPEDPIEVPYLRVANVQRGYIDLDEVKTILVDEREVASLALKAGDILLNEGGDRDKVGRGWVWEDQLPLCIHQNHVFKARPVTNRIPPKLVSLYLNELGREFFLQEGKQTTNLASISLSRIAKAPVPIPPPDEAATILATLERAFGAEREHVATFQSSLCGVAALRRSILAAAFRGELVA